MTVTRTYLLAIVGRTLAEDRSWANVLLFIGGFFVYLALLWALLVARGG